MDINSLLLIAIALSLDAFGVALCIGLNSGVRIKGKVFFSACSGFFQFLFAFIGAYAGVLFNTYIASVPQVIGGTLISIVGVLMLKEGFENKGECLIIKPGIYFVLGISVSIDAMVIGFTILNNINSHQTILKDSLFIGVVTLMISSLAFVVAKYLKKIELLSRYADYIGGIILVIFGIKVMFF